MFLALHELRARDTLAAVPWAKRALQLSIDLAPSYVATDDRCDRRD
jgi:hypothetical protein